MWAMLDFLGPDTLTYKTDPLVNESAKFSKAIDPQYGIFKITKCYGLNTLCIHGNLGNFDEILKQFLAALRIRIHMFSGLPDPDPLVRGMDPDPSIIMQK